jgi:hypothetical protein
MLRFTDEELKLRLECVAFATRIADASHHGGLGTAPVPELAQEIWDWLRGGRLEKAPEPANDEVKLNPLGCRGLNLGPNETIVIGPHGVVGTPRANALVDALRQIQPDARVFLLHYANELEPWTSRA